MEQTPPSPKIPWMAYAARFLPARVRGMHVNHKRIARGILYVGALSLIAKGLMALKEMAVAWQYGTANVVDAYLVSLTLATWLPGTIVSIGIVVLMPGLVAGQAASERRQFIEELNGITFLLGVGLTLLTAFLGPALAHVIAHDLPESSRAMASSMTWKLAPLSFLLLAAGLFSMRLQAKQNYSYTAMEAIPAAGILLLIVLPIPREGGAPLLWGVILGTAVQAAWLASRVRHTDMGLGGMAVSLRAPEWLGMRGAFIAMATAQLVFGLQVPIDQIFAAQIGQGAIAIFGYANRILAVVVSLSILTLARVLLPVLSDVAGRGEYLLGRAQTIKWSWLMLAVMSFVTLFGWVVTPWGVTLLFERGAFTPQDTAAVSQTLRFGLLQLPFYTAAMVFVQWLCAQNQYTSLLIITLIVVAIKIILNILLVPAYALVGLMLSTGGSFLVLWALSAFCVVYRSKGPAPG